MHVIKSKSTEILKISGHLSIPSGSSVAAFRLLMGFLSFSLGPQVRSLPLGLVRSWSSGDTLCWGEGPAASDPESSGWSLSILFTLGKVLVLSQSEDLIRSSLLGSGTVGQNSTVRRWEGRPGSRA